MKIAITGKGGVGKTTIAAMLCHLFTLDNKKVIAIDADPDANLALAMGISQDRIKDINPIIEYQNLIKDRMGGSASLFKINPKVDDVADSIGYKFGNITLLLMGKPKTSFGQCYCPENTFLKALLKHIVLKRDEVVVVDMEAGIEHLSRGTAQAVDAFIIVVEPGMRSILTASTIRDLSQSLGVKNILAVANKIRNTSDLEFINKNLQIPILGYISFDEGLIEADLQGKAISELTQGIMPQVKIIKDNMEKLIYLDKK